MKSIISAVAAAFLAASFTIPADAAGSKNNTTAVSSKAASCKAEAKKKYSAMHPLKRRTLEKKCMGTADIREKMKALRPLPGYPGYGY
jgi:hypothetical protein